MSGELTFEQLEARARDFSARLVADRELTVDDLGRVVPRAPDRVEHHHEVSHTVVHDAQYPVDVAARIEALRLATGAPARWIGQPSIEDDADGALRLVKIAAVFENYFANGASA